MILLCGGCLQLDDEGKEGAGEVWPGDRVATGDRHGTVMYVGPAEFAKEGQTVAGLNLDVKRSTSSNDGKVEGRRYFRCKPGHCLFVGLDDLVPLRPAGDVDAGKAPLLPFDTSPILIYTLAQTYL
jgi:hypothetical protein